MPAEVFIEGKHLGSFTTPEWLQFSLAYFCPKCAEVWARIAVRTEANRDLNFVPLQAACRNHSDYWSVPGSLTYGRYNELLSSLPLPAMLHELKVHITWAEKGFS